MSINSKIVNWAIKRELKKIVKDEKLMNNIKDAVITAFTTKTGWVGLGMLAYAGLGFGLGHMNQDEAFKLAMEGLGFITGRSAINKINK